MAMVLGTLLTCAIVACICWDAVVWLPGGDDYTVSDYIRSSWLRFPCGIGAGLMVAIHFFQRP
jgi:hypothetical protein